MTETYVKRVQNDWSKKQSDLDATKFSGEEPCIEQERKTKTVYNYHHFGAESNQRQIQCTKLHVFCTVQRKGERKKPSLMKGQANCERPLYNFETNEKKKQQKRQKEAKNKNKKSAKPRHVDEHWRIAYPSSI